LREKRIIQSAKPFFPSEDIEKIVEDITEILDSGRLLGVGGKFSEKFEKKFATYIGTKHAVGCNSGTSALELALRGLGVKRGDEVIVPTNTFLASPNSVIFAGGAPILADIDRETLCIDPNSVLEKISNRTKAIMVVHIAGLVCPQIEELLEICSDHELFLIEDAAHAHGAKFREKMAGNLGDIGCFSFYPTKVMSTAEGGMVCLNRDKLTKRLRILLFDGIGDDGLHVELGNNWHMSELHAVLGIYQLNRLEYMVKRRNEIADKYRKNLKMADYITLFNTPPHIRHSYYKFPILIDEELNTEDLITLLKDKYGVETGRVYYPPCHLQPIYRKRFRFKEGMFPTAEEVLKKVICLPIHIGMNDEDVEYVLESLSSALNEVNN